MSKLPKHEQRKRDKAIIEMVKQGYSNAQIGEALAELNPNWGMLPQNVKRKLDTWEKKNLI